MRGVHHRNESCGLFPVGNVKSAGPSVKQRGNKEKELITSVRVQLPNGEVSPPDHINHGGATRRAVQAYVPRQKLHATILEA